MGGSDNVPIIYRTSSGIVSKGDWNELIGWLKNQLTKETVVNSGTYQITKDDSVIRCDGSGIELVLPNPATVAFRKYSINNWSGLVSVGLNPFGTETIEKDSGRQELLTETVLKIYSDGVNWWIGG